MKPKINTIHIDSVSELCGLYSNKKIIKRQTLYIYKRVPPGINLYITEGLKTNPPLSPALARYEPDLYSKMFTIPKGIIHYYHSDWIDPDKYNTVIYDGRIVILTERDDKKALELFENYFWRC